MVIHTPLLNYSTMALEEAHTSPKKRLKLTYLRVTQKVIGRIPQNFTKTLRFVIK